MTKHEESEYEARCSILDEWKKEYLGKFHSRNPRYLADATRVVSDRLYRFYSHRNKR